MDQSEQILRWAIRGMLVDVVGKIGPLPPNLEASREFAALLADEMRAAFPADWFKGISRVFTLLALELEGVKDGVE